MAIRDEHGDDRHDRGRHHDDRHDRDRHHERRHHDDHHEDDHDDHEEDDLEEMHLEIERMHLEIELRKLHFELERIEFDQDRGAMKWDMERMRMDHDRQRMHREMEQRAHGPRPPHDARHPVGPPKGPPRGAPPVVPARALLPWVFEVFLPKDLAPLTGVKARVRIFHGRVLRMQANAKVLRTVLAHRTMPGARLVRPKDLLMEQGPIIARDLLAQALAIRGIRSKVSAEDRSSDEVYWEGTFEKSYPLIR